MKNATGVFLIACSLIVLAFDGSSWLDRDQHIFHFPLLVLFALIFIPRLSLLIVGILAVVSYIVAWNGWIDESLYYFSVEQGWLKAFSPEKGVVNPQYIKLILYSIGLIALSPMVILKRFRTEDRVFGYIGVLACLGVTFLIHQAIPQSTLAWERELIQENMERLVTSVSDSPLFDDICSSFELKCYTDVDPQQLSVVSDNFETQGLLRHYVDQMRMSARSSIAFEHGYFVEGEWRRQIFSVQSTNTQNLNIAIEEKQINISQKINEESFGRLAFAAHLVWGWLFLFVGMAHRSLWKYKIFPKKDPQALESNLK